MFAVVGTASGKEEVVEEIEGVGAVGINEESGGSVGGRGALLCAVLREENGCGGGSRGEVDGCGGVAGAESDACDGAVIGAKGEGTVVVSREERTGDGASVWIRRGTIGEVVLIESESSGGEVCGKGWDVVNDVESESDAVA